MILIYTYMYITVVCTNSVWKLCQVEGNTSFKEHSKNSYLVYRSPQIAFSYLAIDNVFFASFQIICFDECISKEKRENKENL